MELTKSNIYQAPLDIRQGIIELYQEFEEHKAIDERIKQLSVKSFQGFKFLYVPGCLSMMIVSLIDFKTDYLNDNRVQIFCICALIAFLGFVRFTTNSKYYKPAQCKNYQAKKFEPIDHSKILSKAERQLQCIRNLFLMKQTELGKTLPLELWDEITKLLIVIKNKENADFINSEDYLEKNISFRSHFPNGLDL